MKIITDLGEDAFPEETVKAESASESAEPEKTVERQDAPPNEPAAPETSTPATDEAATRKVTTEPRKPLKVPDSIHIRIIPDNLKEYVGPPVYYKDRLYISPPPPGVSTGLGYLGNGSGAVMPIEATVNLHSMINKEVPDTNLKLRCRLCRAKEGCN